MPAVKNSEELLKFWEEKEDSEILFFLNEKDIEIRRRWNMVEAAAREAGKKLGERINVDLLEPKTFYIDKYFIKGI